MNKIKFLTFSVVALLLLNFGILTFLFFSASNDRKHEPRAIIIHELQFDASQIANYDMLIRIHKDKIKNLNDAIKICKNELYNQLKKHQNKLIIDSLFSKIASYQSQIEQTHYSHFLDIRKICKPTQLQDYNLLTSKLSKIFQGKKNKNER